MFTHTHGPEEGMQFDKRALAQGLLGKGIDNPRPEHATAQLMSHTVLP